jgi:pimeloyl-ACP methyl ester carboxylesterase
VVTPLVLVPGLLCDALLWAPQVSGLAGAADCWIADVTATETVAQMAADALARTPYARFALAGLSMGGYVVLEMIRQAPQRIERLALLDTNARSDTTEQVERRNDLIELSQRGRFMGVTDTLMPILIHRDRLSDAALVATVKTMARNVGKDAFIRQQRAIMARIDSRPLLGSINCPTTVICGKQDILTPPELSQEMTALIPNAKLEFIESSGHLSSLEQPAAVNAALARWLA